MPDTPQQPDWSAYQNIDWSQYLPTSGGYSGGNDKSGPFNLATGPDLLGGSIFNSLFGNDDPSWKPYVDPVTGKYVWTDPAKKVPVNVANVPGAPYKPSKQYTDMSKDIQALTDLLPFYSKAVAGQQIPDAQASLAAARSVSPGFQQLQLDLLNQFGVPLTEAGNRINLANAKGTAENDLSVLQGPGSDLVRAALGLYKETDPEFFATRENTSNKLKALMDSIDLTGGLSGSERSEIERGLGQENLRRGNANAPSQLDTVGNAMRYGQAGRKRVLENQGALSAAIAAATQFLPSSRTGIDPFKVATGKSSTPNVGTGNFIGNTNPANTAGANAAGLFGAANQYGLQSNQINSTEKLAKKDWADYLNQVTSSIGNLASAAGGVAGI